MMKCKKCNYPIFSYSQCCPMCGRKIEMAASASKATRPPQTRFDFWLAGLKKQVGTGKVRRPMSA